MANVLADLAVESEAATAGRAAPGPSASTSMATDEHEQLLARLLTPVVKYWTCKRAPQHAAESLECLGGAGYVEESDLPRLFRQSPLNGVWEGSGNVICLDVLRAIMREPLALDAYWAEVGLGARCRCPTRRRGHGAPEGPGRPRRRRESGPAGSSSASPWCSRRR